MAKKVKKVVKQKETVVALDKLPCPRGYAWDGTKCVKDVG